MGRADAAHRRAPPPLDQRLVPLGVGAPQQRRHRMGALLQRKGDGALGEGLPPFFGVGGCGAPVHREHRVEAEHPLPRPDAQIGARSRAGADIAFQLLLDVAQRGRRLDPVRHREGKPHGLPRLMVGVLAQHQHPHRPRRGQPEGIEDLVRRRIDGAHCGAAAHILIQPVKIGQRGLLLKKRFPRSVFLRRGLFQLFAQHSHDEPSFPVGAFDE